MRTPNLGTPFYTTGNVPDEPADLPRFLREELLKIQGVVNLLALGHIDMVNVAPTKPRNGDIRYADGTQFKPNGTGTKGIYYYNGSAWVLLG